MIKQLLKISGVFFLLCAAVLPIKLAANHWEASARVGYFYPTDKKVREIYSDGWPEYQLELAYTFCGPWSVWTNVGYFTEDGHSIGFGDDTRLQLVPVGAGVKYNFNFACNWDAYLGAGATYSFMRIKDDSEFVEEHVSKNAWGGVVKSGIRYHFYQCGFVELFTDYYYTKFNFSGDDDGIERHDANLSGFLFGAGLGISF